MTKYIESIHFRFKINSSEQVAHHSELYSFECNLCVEHKRLLYDKTEWESNSTSIEFLPQGFGLSLLHNILSLLSFDGCL